MKTARPTTTVGNAIRLFKSKLSSLLPGNLPNPTMKPKGIPSTQAMRTAVRETFKVVQMIKYNSGSNDIISLNADLKPSPMGIIVFQFVVDS